MRIVVTGRTGQLVQSLLELAETRPGVEIIAAGRPEIDFCEPHAAADTILALAPDVLINAAAYTAVDAAEDAEEEARRINADAPEALAAAAMRTSARFVQISTDYVFDGFGSKPYDENDIPAPLGAYGRTKLEGEVRVLAANPEAVIVRTAWVYSPFGRNFVRSMMTLGETRDVLNVVDDQVGNPTSALDLADGLLALIHRWKVAPEVGLGATYHLAGTGYTSWAGFAAEIMACRSNFGLPACTVVPIPSSDWPTRAVRPKSSRLNCSAFTRDVGYTAPPWQTSTADVIRRMMA